MSLLIALCVATTFTLAFADLPANYESLTAAKKQDILWDKISATPYPPDQLPTDSNGVFQSLNLLKSSFDTKAFTWDGDEMIKDRLKLIHTYGSTAKTEVQIFASSNYTGVFAPGNKIALSRLSVAAIDKKNFVPGMVIKILVDGKPSINLFAMLGVDGQGPNFNFFENTFTNFIPEAKGVPTKILSAKFRDAIDDLPGGDCERPLGEGKLPLFTPASQYVDGRVTTKPKAPLAYHLMPNAAIGWSGSDTTDLRIQLAKIPVGSVLYTIAVSAVEGGPQAIIGKLVLKSPFVASEYEDRTLFFKHHAKRC